MRPVFCVVLLLAAACASRSQHVAPDSLPTKAPVLSHEEQIARDLEQIMAQDLGPVPTITPGDAGGDGRAAAGVPVFGVLLGA